MLILMYKHILSLHTLQAVFTFVVFLIICSMSCAYMCYDIGCIIHVFFTCNVDSSFSSII